MNLSTNLITNVEKANYIASQIGFYYYLFPFPKPQQQSITLLSENPISENPKIY